MAQAYRRVILKPAGLSESDSSRLAEMLAAAIARQQQLASKSVHVLQFAGRLEETEQAFYVEHEPAEALPVEGLFDQDFPGAEDKQLLRLAAALFDALAAAHGKEQQRSQGHGGLCPGALLVSPDGIEKVSDFGFAPAICATLGVESYVNLAVGPKSDDTPETQATGAWEVLSPDEFERQDRLCAFIDPEKYGTQTLKSFEPGSDIIAAGFILHLLAEHQHPYLYADPDAHRFVEMSEYMAMGRYNGARRKDLRESQDPAVKLWCELVGKMLARLPQERPSAAELGRVLGQHVRPMDAGEILRRRLEAVDELVERNAWEEVRRVVKGLADSEALPLGLAERANALLRQANANLLLNQATGLMAGDDWPAAQGPLDSVLALPALPKDVAEKAQKAAGVLKHSLAAKVAIEQIEARLAEDEGNDPSASQALLQGLAPRFDELPPEASLLPPVRTRLQQVKEDFSARLESATAEVQAAIEADRAQAEAWLGRLESTFKAREWKPLEALLTDRPELRHWPDEILQRANDIKQRKEEQLAEERRRAAVEADRAQAEQWLGRLESAFGTQAWDNLAALLADRPQLKYWPEKVLERADALQQSMEKQVAEQRRLAAVEADRKTAEQWVTAARQAVESQKWDRAEQILAEEPQLTHWPREARDDAHQLAERVQTFRKEQADFDQARRWHDELRQAAGAGQWSAAAELLARKPTLEHWPPEVLEEEARYREEVGRQLEAIELERLQKEEESRRVQSWLAQARVAAEKQDWEEVLNLLATPPDVEHLPEEAEAEVTQLTKTCHEELGAAALENLQVRTRLVRKLAQEYVENLIGQELGTFLDTRQAKTTIDAEELTSPHPEADGCARLTVSLAGAPATEDSAITSRFDFRIQTDPPQVCDDQGALRESLTAELARQVAQLQKSQAGKLFAPLRKGVFPKAKVKVKLEALTERAPATVDLLGSGSAEATIETEIAWDRAALSWVYADPAAFSSRAGQVAAKATRKVLAPKLLEGSEILRRYKSVLGFQVVSPSSLAPEALAGVLPLEGRLTVEPGEPGDRQTLHTFPISCPQIGKATVEADLAAAESNLCQLVVAAQNRARDAIAAELRSRFTTAPAKVKITAQPRRISDPVDEVRFDLRSRGRAPVTLTAGWDVEAFTYQPANGWEEALSELLAPAAPAEAPPKGPARPIAVGVAAVAVLAVAAYFLRGKEDDSPPDNGTPGVTITQSGGSTEVDEDGPKSDTYTVVLDHAPSADVTVTVAPDSQTDLGAGPGTAIELTFTSEDWDTPQRVTVTAVDDAVEEGTHSSTITHTGASEDGVYDGISIASLIANVTDNDRPRVPPSARPSFDGALAEVRDILLRSAHFTEANVAGLMKVEAAESSEPYISYRVPGLPEPEGAISLELSADRQSWVLNADRKNALENRVGRLDALLNLPKEAIDLDSEQVDLNALTAALESAPLTGWIAPSRVQARFGAEPRWQLSDGNWSARNVAMELSFSPASGSAVVPLAQAESDLESVGGILRAITDPERMDDLIEQLRSTLKECQTRSLQGHTGELQEMIDSIGGRVDQAPEAIDKPDETLTLIVHADGLVSRSFPLAWDPAELAFRFDADGTEWQGLAGQVVLAGAVIERINGRQNPEEDWLGVNSSGPISELSPPDPDGRWTLAVAAPWAEGEKPPAELAESDRLPILVEWPEDGADAEQFARDIVAGGAPDYWQLVGRFLSHTADPFFLAELVRADPSTAGVVGYLKTEPAFVLPRMGASGRPLLGVNADTGLPETLQAAFKPAWVLRQAPEGVDQDVLRQAVQGLVDAREQTMTLRLADDGQIRYAGLGDLVSELEETLGRVRALEACLATSGARRLVEDAIRAELLPDNQDQATISEPQCLVLLQEIWRAKGISAGDDLQSLNDLSSQLQRTANLRKGVRTIPPRSLFPSVMVEYFCGPQSTYAVVWSIQRDRADKDLATLDEGPFLISLGPTANLAAAARSGEAPDDLGTWLFDPVFDAVRRPVAAATAARFQNQLGLVLALDDQLWLISGLEQSRFRQRASSLKFLDRPGPAAQLKRWSSLQELREGTQRSDYTLVQTLPEPSPPDNDQRWAIHTLVQASRSTE